MNLLRRIKRRIKKELDFFKIQPFAIAVYPKWIPSAVGYMPERYVRDRAWTWKTAKFNFDREIRLDANIMHRVELLMFGVAIRRWVCPKSL